MRNPPGIPGYLGEGKERGRGKEHIHQPRFSSEAAGVGLEQGILPTQRRQAVGANTREDVHGASPAHKGEKCFVRFTFQSSGVSCQPPQVVSKWRGRSRHPHLDLRGKLHLQ